MTIYVRDIWPIENLTEFKVHFARYNQDSEPLDVWVRSRSEWQGWQEYHPQHDEFNRLFIFSLMRFYHEPDTWLFGGSFVVLERFDDRYRVELTGLGARFIGRLKIKYPHKIRVTRANLEQYYSDFEVKEILPEPYSGF